jgi:hypothetical protein
MPIVADAIGQEVVPEPLDAPAGRRALAVELREAAVDAQNPSRLEAAVAAAFRSLGVSAHHDGRAGKPDVIVKLGFGSTKEETAIVDAKATASGDVPERQINWDTLHEHATDAGAGIIAVVGPAFTDERLLRRAREHKAILIETSILSEIVSRHDETPFSPTDLKLLFAVDGPAVLDTVWTVRRAQTVLVGDVLSALVSEAEEEDNVLGGGLSAIVLYAMLRKTVSPAPSIESINAALTLLSSPLLRAVEQRGDRFFATERPEVTATRLRALARATNAMEER